VKISQPSSVMPIECSNCAESDRSRVTAVHAGIDHRLDREEHAGAQFRPGAGAADMDDLRRIVEHPADAVPAEIADHAVAVLLGKALDRMADVTQPVAGLRLRNAQHHRLVRHLHQPARLDRHLADQEHAAGIAVPAVQQRRHVDIDNIAVLQRPRAGNAVAHDVVDRDAAALGIAAIPQRCRVAPAADHRRADDIVQRLGLHARHHVRRDFVHHLRSKAPCGAHAGKAFLAVQLDRAGARQDVAVPYGHIFGHAGDIG
jgi:hypothetical protein